MADYRDALIRRQRDEIDELRERLRQREERQKPEPIRFPRAWKLAYTQHRLLELLFRRQFCSKDYLFSGLYGNRGLSDRGAHSDDPVLKNLGVQMCILRRLLKEAGANYIKIETFVGQGYQLTPASRARLAAIAEVDTQSPGRGTMAVPAARNDDLHQGNGTAA